jgi:glycosyltransferase involved in cell wall biosynthesis
LNVLFVSGYNPFIAGSGPGNGLYYLSQALADLGCDVHILTLSANETGNLGKVKIHYYNPPANSLKDSWVPFSIFSIKQIRELCNACDIHLVNGRSPTTFGYAMLEHNKLPYIVSVHGTAYGELSSYYSTPLNFFNTSELKDTLFTQPMWASLTKFEYKNADRVVAVSKSVADEVIHYFHVNPQRVRVIPNGVHNPFKTNNVDEEDGLILSIGRLIWRKGFAYLIKAMPAVLKEYSNARLSIVGSGSYDQQLVELTKKLGVAQAVTFHPVMQKEDLFRLYLKAQVYVQPSLYEPLGNTVLEAMASGKPVVASRVGGIPEAITDQKSGLLIDPYSSEQIAQKIILLLSDAAYRKTLGQSAKEKVSRDFSWETVAKKTLNLYNELV